MEDAISFYRKKIKGVVVYDPNVQSTSNMASSIAGIENLMAVRYDTSPISLYSRVVLHGPNLPVKVWLVNQDGTAKFSGEGKIADTGLTSSGSLKNDPYLWFIEKYDICKYQIPSSRTGVTFKKGYAHADYQRV